MIPKSVSVSTLTLALGAVFTWPVWGWAGEVRDLYVGKVIDEQTAPPRMSDSKTKPDWSIQMPSEWVVTCNEANTKCWTPCEVRMREAMLSMREYMNEARIPGPEARDRKEFFAVRKQWEAVMNECVEDGK